MTSVVNDTYLNSYAAGELWSRMKSVGLGIGTLAELTGIKANRLSRILSMEGPCWPHDRAKIKVCLDQKEGVDRPFPLGTAPLTKRYSAPKIDAVRKVPPVFKSMKVSAKDRKRFKTHIGIYKSFWLSFRHVGDIEKSAEHIRLNVGWGLIRDSIIYFAGPSHPVEVGRQALFESSTDITIGTVVSVDSNGTLIKTENEMFFVSRDATVVGIVLTYELPITPTIVRSRESL